MRGFSVLELLIVLLVLGVLVVLTLPLIEKNIEKSRISEGYMYVGAIKRAQEAYYAETQKYAEDISNLDLGMTESEGRNFKYSTDADTGITNPAGFQYNAYIIIGHPNTDRPGMANVKSHVHIHSDNKIGEWKSSAEPHSHSDYSHTHDINYGNPF